MVSFLPVIKSCEKNLGKTGILLIYILQLSYSKLFLKEKPMLFFPPSLHNFHCFLVPSALMPGVCHPCPLLPWHIIYFSLECSTNINAH